jgi:hypothetical protein
MKKLTIVFLVVFSFSLLAQVEKFGKEITLKEKTKISEIVANPEAFLDKVVLVEGKVLDVCPKAGCWMELQGENDTKIRIKVKDGDIVFPVSAVGSKAVAEGKVYKIELTKEEAIEYFEHLAEESGKEFDPSSVTGPVTIYQIRGMGAEIEVAKQLETNE